MKKLLKLADNLSLPLEFATERIAFLARTGSGKSGGMRVLSEQFFDAGLFFIFVDPKGDAWGIRADGTEKGRPVLIMGGDHGDIPLEPGAGSVAAEFLVRERIPAVVDISDFSTSQMWRFMASFTKTAYKLNREVVTLLIDEIDMLAGQTYFDPDCLHGIQLIQNKGRARGWGFILASQRPQVVNKTVLNACGTLIAMQTLGDDAMKVVKSWLSQTGTKEVVQEILSQVPTLKTREAFVYSPQTLGIDPRRITFTSFTTFDSMRTPKPGETVKTPKSVADIDISAVQREMAATIEKAKADDPVHLKKEITELKLKLKSAESNQMTVEMPAKEVAVAIFPEESADKILDFCNDVVGFLSDTYNAAESALRTIEIANENIGKAVNHIRSEVAASPSKLPVLPDSYQISVPQFPPEDPASRAKREFHIPPKPRSVNEQRPVGNPDADVTPREQKVLDAVALCNKMGISNPKRGVVAFMSGYSDNSTFRNVLGSLSGKELLYYPSAGVLGLTEAGGAIADSGTAPTKTLADLHELWLSKVTPREQRVLQHLLSIYPSTIPRAGLAKECGYEDNSTFRNILGSLSGLGAIRYPVSGYVAATELLFPEGLR